MAKAEASVGKIGRVTISSAGSYWGLCVQLWEKGPSVGGSRLQAEGDFAPCIVKNTELFAEGAQVLFQLG